MHLSFDISDTKNKASAPLKAQGKHLPAPLNLRTWQHNQITFLGVGQVGNVRTMSEASNKQQPKQSMWVASHSVMMAEPLFLWQEKITQESEV